MQLSDSGSVAFIVFIFFGCLDLFINKSIIATFGITPSNLDQDPKTVAAWAELSDNKCQNFYDKYLPGAAHVCAYW